jgi:hypothetical protein
MMEWLKTIAPTVATALGGPLAGMAVSAVSKALGCDPDEVQGIISSNKLTAEQVASIQLAELELKKQAQSMNLDFAKLTVEDRKSARDMQIATKSMLVPSLAIIIVSAFIGVVIATLGGFAVVDSVLAGTLIGYLSAKAEQVVNFYFGSSAGSKEKTELLSKAEPVK